MHKNSGCRQDVQLDNEMWIMGRDHYLSKFNQKSKNQISKIEKEHNDAR